MKSSALFSNLYTGHPEFPELIRVLASSPGDFRVEGLKGSAAALLAADVVRETGTTHLFILPEPEDAAYFFNDLEVLLPADRLVYFPSIYKRSMRYGQIDPSLKVLRHEALSQITSRKKGICLVTWPESLVEKVAGKQTLLKNSLRLKTGAEVRYSDLQSKLETAGFQYTDIIIQPGEYALRGGIMDVFSWAAEKPCRIEFSGNTIESIRLFDIETQLSTEKVKEVTLVPDMRNRTERNQFKPLFDLLPEHTRIWVNNYTWLQQQIEELSKQGHQPETEPESGEEGSGPMPLIQPEELEQARDKFGWIEIGPLNTFPTGRSFYFHTSAQPAFGKNFELFAQKLHEQQSEGYQTLILASGESQKQRLEAILQEINPELQVRVEPMILHEGFTDHDLRIAVYTDHQLFERYHKFRIRGGFTRKEALNIEALKQLKPGDYVVHVDHGIGQFGGLEKINNNGKIQEAVKLVYKDQDILYVSIHALHRISKYKGKDNAPPKIYKLGSRAWQNLKQKTKNRVKDIARDLIALYARRMQQKGFAFSPDSYLQQELEASFIYEDTPDQETATTRVKEGMESNWPMDMLVCGDVGFGKTEVAIRAAFKAVADSKQVAVLVPTTILAFQHFRSFSERLKDFPCTIEYLSRLRKAADQKQIIRKIREGKVDIVIGTHRLISKDIQFKDLGLLIIDEEQKFGVAVKERLKQMRAEVDTLTLTATPIPRTLQFSLMGARDLVVINTPPPNRHPIITELHVLNPSIIREGIEYELNRGGQVFFIHNRIDNIAEVEKMVRTAVPHARTVVSHGRMKGPELERIMLDFIEGEYDVLIATTIIESGLDIPNANTIFIHNAQNFGLSELHQLRGRVGRSNRKAFCYLLAPPLTTLSPEARRRLKAIAEFSDLGSGFSIALQDLDIRGAGNLLGAEQSGFISDIGLETYQRILQEAMEELRSTEFSQLFDGNEAQKTSTEAEAPRQQGTPSVGAGAMDSDRFVKDCHIDTDLEVFFPDSFVPNITEKMKLYRELDHLASEQDLEKFMEKLRDRFGAFPPEATALLDIVRIRMQAVRLAMEKIVLKQNRMICYFVGDRQSPFYTSPLFTSLLSYIQGQPLEVQLKQTHEKLMLSFPGIRDTAAALKVLRSMAKHCLVEVPE